MAGDTKNAPIKQAARFGVIAIGLAEMRAIAAELGSESSIVIQQKRDIPRGRNGHQDFRRALDLVFTGVLQAQLQAGNIAGIERCGERIAKDRGIQSLRGDEVKPAESVRHYQSQGNGAITEAGS